MANFQVPALPAWAREVSSSSAEGGDDMREAFRVAELSRRDGALLGHGL